jgi:exonuclease VII small subunit
MDKLNKARKRIEELMERNGGEITASSVVSEAAKKHSVLHGFFEWDDTVAGREFRLIQARKLIKRVNVVVESPAEKFFHVPVVVSVADDDQPREGVYKKGSAIVKVITEYQRALDEAMRMTAALNKAVSELRSLAEGQDDDKLVVLSCVMKALETADSGLRSLH